MQTERKFDMNAEREVNSFLCRYFYPVIFPGFTSENSLDMQYAGVDVSFNNIFIDEKCQLEKLNTEFINTQCLELCSINRAGKFSLGWFLDPRKKTTHYLFTWVVSSNQNDKRNLRECDIICMRAILVSIVKLKQYLSSIGITDQILHKEMLNMLVHHKANRVQYNKMYIDLNNSTRIVRTLSKKEAPINYVVPRIIYEQCCDGKYTITREGVTSY